MRGFQEHVAAQEAEQGVPHVSTFCAVRMRHVDDQLLDWLRGAAPPAAGGPVARQVCGRPGVPVSRGLYKQHAPRCMHRHSAQTAVTGALFLIKYEAV